MKRDKLITSLIALATVLTACGGSDDDAEFMEGREQVAVYELLPPEGFDPTDQVREWAKLVGIESTVYPMQEGDRGVGVTEDMGDDRIKRVAISNQRWSFSYGTTPKGDVNCDECPPATISIDDAIDRSKELFEQFGFDPTNFIWSGATLGSTALREHDHVRVKARRTLNGAPYRTFDVTFAFGDEIAEFRGYVSDPVPLGTVGLLTPQEAYAQEAAETGAASPIESFDNIELEWSVLFNTQELRKFVIPIYRLPINKELGLSTELLAIRRQDLQDIPAD